MESPQKKFRNADPAEFSNDAIEKCEPPSNSIPCLNYDILRIIVQYLNAKDLRNAAKVCKMWLEAANNEKRTRGPEYTVHRFTTGLFKEHLRPVWIDPSIGFYFATGMFYTSFVGNMKKAEDNRNNTVRLSRNYSSVILKVDSIIVDNVEMENYPYSRMLSAYLPQIPNVEVNVFTLSGTLLRTVSVTKAFKKFINNFMTDETSTQNHENSRCLMLFCNIDKREAVLDIIIPILKQRCRNKRVSAWGGVIDCVHAYKKASRLTASICQDITVVAISGRMQSWSMIVDRKCKTKQQVEKRLTMFKDQVTLKKHSMGFMFACRARGQNLYNGERNVESTIFKNLFPQVPLVGCFGDGEFGTNTISVDNVESNNPNESAQTNYPSCNSWYNEFSTVFMILTYD